jgi:parallel beta-helix repeat protein
MKKTIGILIVFMLLIAGSIGFVTGSTVSEKISQPLIRGQTLYVGGIGPGNYTRVQDAVDNASSGDTVFVYDDSSPYKENITISKSLTIQGENKQTTIIDGSYGSGLSFHIYSDNVTVTRFTIQNTGTAVYIGGVGETASHNIITDNIILNSHSGIVMFYGSTTKPDFSPYGYNIISNNYIKNTTYYGIMLNEGQNNLITRNTITENHGLEEQDYSGFGIEVSGAFNNISYNNVSNNNGFGIIIGDTYKTIVYRNNIENNGLYGLGIACGSFDRIIQNNFIGNRRQAVYDQQIKIFFLTHKGHYPILPCIWKENYWNKPRLLPYIIPGSIGYTGLISWSFYAKYDIIPTNFIRFDLHPAQEPYDLSIGT